MFNFNSEYYVSRGLETFLLLLINITVAFILKRIISTFFLRITHRITSERALARTQTLSNLFKNIVDFTLFLIFLLIILSSWGINIVPILTGASILGLAVSFGAQTLIKDIIAGMFIILEDQFHIGDRIQVDKVEGEVVNISLRLTILKDKRGNYIYIPNSQITTLIRFTAPKRIIT